MLSVVTGPPASGKSTFVELRAQRDDIVIDFDKIAYAMTNAAGSEIHEYGRHVRTCAAAAWGPAVDAAMRYVGPHNVWIIHSAPSAQHLRRYRARGAHITSLAVSNDEQRERLSIRVSQHLAR